MPLVEISAALTARWNSSAPSTGAFPHTADIARAGPDIRSTCQKAINGIIKGRSAFLALYHKAKFSYLTKLHKL